MTELLTSAQMRAIDQAAIASGEVTGLELMDRAGRGVVEAIFEEWPELGKTSHRAVVLCGPGNNGGDGFVVARLLKEWGWEVEVFLYGDPSKLPPDAKVNYERWREMGNVAVLAGNSRISDIELPDGPDVIIDALFGTGLNRPFRELFDIRYSLHNWGIISSAYAEECKVVCVDMPSGFCADSGRYLGVDDPNEEAVFANLTVSFHREKVGHQLGLGTEYAGRIRVVDIGLESSLLKRAAIHPDRTRLVGRIHGYVLNKTVFHQSNASLHKYSHGHALVLSGPLGQTGAARLAARGALRIGAGVVTLGCPTNAIPENAAHQTAIMLRAVPNSKTLSQILYDPRITALCLGPGMGLTKASRTFIAAALRAARPTVLDADALTLISGDSTLFAQLHDKCILTPHAGEFARLFPDIAEMLNTPATKGPAYSKVDATRDAAKRAGCVVLFKGPDTVIAAPDGQCSINSAHYERAAPWLATAGSGDVLAGFITGLLARGFAPMQATETAAWLHVECARSFGPGLIAEDLPEELPKVFRALGL